MFRSERFRILFLAMIAAASAQTAAFEAVSVRTSNGRSQCQGILKPSPGGLAAVNYPLDQYIACRRNKPIAGTI
ncbi:MAG TPA: hypothetical protein VG345_12315 [Bryobacteraceae bacterium]|nr:hypothetical protein [Bryobacteraceae bacterium]